MFYALLTSPFRSVCTAHHILLDLTTLIIFGEVHKLGNTFIHSFQVLCHFMLFGSKYFPQRPVLKHLNLSPSLSVRDKFHTHTKQQVILWFRTYF
jgi:hypothetical protein